MAAGSMAKATVHEPVGRKSLWGHPGWQLPAYIQHVANDLREKGHPESRAIAMAVGIIKNWAHGHDGKGGRVSAETQAAAAKALAEWQALKAKAAGLRASKSLSITEQVRVIDLATTSEKRSLLARLLRRKGTR